MKEGFVIEGDTIYLTTSITKDCIHDLKGIMALDLEEELKHMLGVSCVIYLSQSGQLYPGNRS
jgi:hypothetical protein